MLTLRVFQSQTAMKSIAYLIFNPVAGRGDPEQELATIESILGEELELKIYHTTPEISAEDLAIQAIAQQPELVIASGGDGTISAVAGKLANTGIPFGIIARGTANAFANALGIPTDINNACATILANRVRAIDLATCNDSPMLLLVGIGLEANAVEAASREAKDRFGVLAYIMAGIQQIRALELFDVTIETEETVITCQATAITIANAAPPTSILAQGPDEVIYTDGLLDITIFAPVNTLSALMASYHLLQSALLNRATVRDDIGYLRARTARITTNPPQKVVVDGEVIEADVIEVKSIPLGLNIFVPEIIPEQPETRLSGLPNLEIHDRSTINAA
jgi:YegS/Rv2252/BmrU family lipid kinase